MVTIAGLCRELLSAPLSYAGKGRGGLYKAPINEKEESERLRGERDQLQFIDLTFAR